MFVLHIKLLLLKNLVKKKVFFLFQSIFEILNKQNEKGKVNFFNEETIVEAPKISINNFKIHGVK